MERSMIEIGDLNFARCLEVIKRRTDTVGEIPEMRQHYLACLHVFVIGTL